VTDSLHLGICVRLPKMHLRSRCLCAGPPAVPGYYLLAEYFTARNGIEENSAKIGVYPLASSCSFTTPKTYLMHAVD
jgi:hypothetical protein